MRTSWLFAVALASLPLAAAGAPPDVGTIVGRMKTALEPARPSARRMTFQVSGATGVGPHLVLGQARKKVGGAERILNVVLAPESMRGLAYLVQQSSGADNVQWMYLPAIGRVRKIVSPEAYVAFLNSEFTYSDLGFVDTAARYSLLGEEQHGGTSTYKIESIPKEHWYYARTVIWIAKDSGLPLERNLYDASNVLWKVERWEQVADAGGVPTPRRISMEDVQAKARTDIAVAAVTYDAEMPDALFDPAELAKAVSSPIWNALGG